MTEPTGVSARRGPLRAGQRVQIIKRDPAKGGVLKLGT